MTQGTIERILAEQKEEKERKISSFYCARREESLVNLSSNLAQVVIGVRRSGKSTMCFNLIKSSGRNFAYVNFDDERFENIEAEDLNKILECLYKLYGSFDNLFMDEVQNVPSWHLFVNRLLRQSIKILITGSNSKLLGGELATHLTGRYMKTELYPFSFQEFCLYKRIAANTDTTLERGLLRRQFDFFLQEGGMPELYTEIRKTAYIDTLVDNIVTNDIEHRYKIRYKSTFEKLTQHILNNAPICLNYKKLCNEFGLSSMHTAENYVRYIANAYLIVGIHKYSTKSQIRVTKEKFYAVDTAFMNMRQDAFVGKNLGWRLESIVCIELLRRCRPDGLDIYYYSLQSYEVDFVVCRNRKVEKLIQVSYDISSEKTQKREIKALLKASEETGCNNLMLLTLSDEDTIEVEGKTIEVMPVYRWLLTGDGDAV